MTRKSRRIWSLLIAGTVLFVATGVGWRLIWRSPVEVPGLDTYAEESRNALVENAFGESAQHVVYLDQGWTARDSMEFYTRPQGSLLVPYAWFLVLEQPDNDRPFRELAHISRMRYLPQKPCASNPDGLPVGFAREPKGRGHDEDYLGITCAACHTTEIHHDRVAYRIDGGPALADAQTFVRQLTKALKATLDDPKKFERFAVRILKPGHSRRDREQLRKELEEVHQQRHDYNVRNRTPHPYGFGRLDAFGHIMNEVLVPGLGVTDETQRQDPDAPVSYPFLWDTPHHDYVQWNAIARNKILGSERLGGLARNTGEVLGVFGQFRVSEPHRATALTGYRSSVRVPDLIELENLVRKLHSPRWPATFPPIDEEKRAAGEKLYANHCARCHAAIDRTDPNRAVRAVKTPVDRVGTDPRMATNFAHRKGKTGRVEGRRSLFVAGPRFGPRAEGDELFVHVIIGVILNNKTKALTETEVRDLRRRTSEPNEDNPLVYKARPLNGIWATAPFLHNGSVPNLYQLLLPAEERVKEFHVGRRDFDPKHVGFQTASFEGAFLFRTSEPGNSNAGHEYGTHLTELERWQLVEYLKSL